MAATLVELFETVTASSSEPVRFLDTESVIEQTTWAEIVEGARTRAANLQARGLGSGDRVAVLGFTSRELVETLFGILLAGGTVVMLPLPMRLGSREAFIEQTRNRLRAADAKFLTLDSFFAAQYEPGDQDPPIIDIASLAARGAVFETVAVLPSDLAVLQFTSGSTADPKAVRLHHGAICANLFSISDAASVYPGCGDHCVTWLPLYHDMGLIGTLFVPATNGFATSLAAPQAFLSRPAMWLEAASRLRATVTVAPNFAYSLATRALGRATGLDLSPLRIGLCGAEPIDASVFERFLDAGAEFGLRRGMPLPCYGLAEATLAVTFSPLGRELVVDTVDRRALEDGRYAVPAAGGDVKRVVGLGYPLRGIAVRVVDDEGVAVGEREVGHVLVASASTMQGYDRHPAETARALQGGWLHTGDLGYTVGGELFICGRQKDLIIIGGRNIWPEDVEAAAQRVSGVRAGNAVAFGVDRDAGREALVLVAETKLAANEASCIASEVASVVKQHIGLTPRHVVLLAPGELPKTSSGKLQRGLARQRYLKGELSYVASHGPGF